jgi:hypothetical protein
MGGCSDLRACVGVFLNRHAGESSVGGAELVLFVSVAAELVLFSRTCPPPDTLVLSEEHVLACASLPTSPSVTRLTCHTFAAPQGHVADVYTEAADLVPLLPPNPPPPPRPPPTHAHLRVCVGVCVRACACACACVCCVA